MGEDVREALVPGPSQRFAQVRGLVREHGDHLVPVPAGGGPRDAVIAGQCLGGRAVAEPAQAQHSLPTAGPARGVPRRRCSAASSFATNCTSSPRDVKRGTIGDHVEPFRRRRSCGETSSTGAPRSFPRSPACPRVCPDVSIWAGESTSVRAYFAKITSLSGEGFEDLVGALGLHERLGSLLHSLIHLRMSASNSVTLRCADLCSFRFVSSANQCSARFSHDELAGVKCRRKRDGATATCGSRVLVRGVIVRTTARPPPACRRWPIPQTRQRLADPALEPARWRNSQFPALPVRAQRRSRTHPKISNARIHVGAKDRS